MSRYLEAARRLAPAIAAAADEADRQRRLTEPVVTALHDAGLFRLLLPAPLGGAEVDPVTFVEVVEAIAKADASAAWCLCQASGCSMVAAYLRPDVAREIFGDDPCAVLVWGPGPGARAVATDGGYRIRGRWSFASGCRHATWLGAYCPIYEPDGTPRRRPDGAHEGRTMLLPAVRATLHDVWHVLGLRATASDAFSVEDLVVPHAYSVARDDPGERRHPGPLLLEREPLRLGLRRRGARHRAEHAGGVPRAGRRQGPARGPARAAGQRGRPGRGGAGRGLGSARAYLLASLEEIWRSVGRTGSLTLEQRVRIRLASTHAIHQAKEVVDAAYHAAGSTAILMTAAFERRFRDMHAVTQQLQGRQAHFETVGRFLLGLEPDTTFP